MNFFKSMYNVNKLAKTIKKECNSLYEPLLIKSDSPTEESIVIFNDVLSKALSLIDVAEIDPGMYILQITDNDNTTSTKLIKH